MAKNAKRPARARRKQKPGTKPIAEPDTTGIVRRARTRLKLTQVELGERIGVSTRTIIRWENGWPFPEWARLRIEDLLKMKPT